MAPSFTFLFHIVTLPVEIDASRRGLAFLKANAPAGYNGAKKVLIAAALICNCNEVSALQLYIYLVLLKQKTGNGSDSKRFCSFSI